MATERAMMHMLVDAGILIKKGAEYFFVAEEKHFKAAADSILETKPDHTVTTLEIKELLRDRYFYVTQAMVSDAMTNFVRTGDYIATQTSTNGVRHRVFSSKRWMSQYTLDVTVAGTSYARTVDKLADVFLKKIRGF